MFDFDVIDEYQIEVTTYCNAACPQCPRNNNGSGSDAIRKETVLLRPMPMLNA